MIFLIIATPAFATGRAVPTGINEAVKIEVYKTDPDKRYDGDIYRIDYDDLVINGLVPSYVDPRTFKIYNLGEEIAVYVNGESDASFDNGDYIEFYGESHVSTRFTYTNVYWLSWGAGTGKRMAIRNSVGGTTPISSASKRHYERNQRHRSRSAVSDPWYFTSYVYKTGSRSYTVSLEDVVKTDGSDGCMIYADVYGYRWGNTDDSYRLTVSVNGNSAGFVDWNETGQVSFSASLDSAWLNEGNNTINFSSSRIGSADDSYMVYLDWIKIYYRRSFEAIDGKHLFSSSAGGNYTFSIANIDRPDTKVFDITDHDNVVLIEDLSVVGSTLTVHDSPNSATNYIAATDINIVAVSSNDITLKKVEFSSLLSTNNEADYIAVLWGDDSISDHEKEMADTLDELVEYREAQGMDVEVVRTCDIYNEFNYGLPSPQAVKDFFEYTYYNWKAKPDYALLVGDGSYDYRNDHDYDEYYMRHVPCYMFNNEDIINDSGIGYTASDDWFVCFDGVNDVYPEILIGRMPARDKTELSIMIEKTLAVEEADLEESWTKNLIFVSGGESDFELTTNNLLKVPGDTYLSKKLSFADPAYASLAEFNEDLRASINNGALLINYAGHGHLYLWGSSLSRWPSSAFFMGKNMFYARDDVADLRNEGKYPVFIALSCVNGYFLKPVNEDCLAEELLREKDKGAVAMFASSGVSLPDYQRLMAEGIYDALFVQGDRRLGSAIARAKLYVTQRVSSFSENAVRSFMLFGDPALLLPKSGSTNPLFEDETDVEISGEEDVEEGEDQELVVPISDPRISGFDSDGDFIPDEINKLLSGTYLGIDEARTQKPDILDEPGLSGKEEETKLVKVSGAEIIEKTIADKRNFFKRHKKMIKQEEAMKKEEERKEKEDKRTKNIFQRIGTAVVNFFRAIIDFFKRIFGF